MAFRIRKNLFKRRVKEENENKAKPDETPKKEKSILPKKNNFSSMPIESNIEFTHEIQGEKFRTACPAVVLNDVVVIDQKHCTSTPIGKGMITKETKEQKTDTITDENEEEFEEEEKIIQEFTNLEENSEAKKIKTK